MIIGRREFDTEHNTYIMGIVKVLKEVPVIHVNVSPL